MNRPHSPGSAPGRRMRDVVAAHAFPLAAPGSITISLGVAVFPHDADDPLGLIQAADRALYRAKAAGKNCVAVDEPGGPGPG